MYVLECLPNGIPLGSNKIKQFLNKNFKIVCEQWICKFKKVKPPLDALLQILNIIIKLVLIDHYLMIYIF